MRDDIINAVREADKDTLIDVALTFKMITKADVDEYFESGKLPKNATKTNIRKRALADEDIAEYLLLTI